MFDKIARDGTLATDLSKVSFSVDLFNYFIFEETFHMIFSYICARISFPT